MQNILKKGYQSLIFFGGLLKSPILLACRLYWGSLFMLLGWEKLNHISPLVQILKHYHLSPPIPLAYLSAGTEFIGGICLILGFASRLAALPLAFNMIVAYSTVHVESLRAIFEHPSLFVAQAPFNFLLTCILIFAFGPGRFSLDYLMERCFFGEKFSTHK